MRWGSIWRRRGRRAVPGRWGALGGAGALLALVAACALRVPTGERRARAAFPRVRPARLAHLLADFTAHPHAGGAGAGGGGGAWRVEDERGNYTWWWYRVTFACGARCAGEARVAAGPGPAQGAGAGDAHLVSLRVTLCTALPLLPWLSYCDELEVESAVRGAGAGSLLEERAHARCAAPRVLAGACARVLDAHRAAHRAALAARAEP